MNEIVEKLKRIQTGKKYAKRSSVAVDFSREVLPDMRADVYTEVRLVLSIGVNYRVTRGLNDIIYKAADLDARKRILNLIYGPLRAQLLELQGLILNGYEQEATEVIRDILEETEL